MNKKGFTLIELMIVLAILGILTLIGVIHYRNIKSEAEKRACIETRIRVIKRWKMNNQIDDEVELKDVLDNNLNKWFEKTPKCSSDGIYSVDKEKKCIECSKHGKVFYDFLFGNIDFDFSAIEDMSSIDKWISGITGKNDWEIKNDRLINSETGQRRILFYNSFDEYKIELTAKVDKKVSGGHGYGISFETSTDKDAKDTGYIFQFDPGYGVGEFIFRKRNGSKEENPFERISLAEAGFSNDFDWYKEHKVEIRVINTENNKKKVSVFIDDKEITKGTEVLIDSMEDATNSIGLRTWGKTQAEFENLSLNQLD